MTTKLKMILLIGLSLAPAQAFASLMQMTVTWSLQYGPLDGSVGERPPLDGSPNPFAGTAVFQYDPAALTGVGSESIEGIMLMSLSPSPLTIGSTDFTVANAKASIYFEDGAFDFLSVYGLPNDNNVSIDEGGPDFQVVISFRFRDIRRNDESRRPVDGSCYGLQSGERERQYRRPERCGKDFQQGGGRRAGYIRRDR